MSNLAMNKDQFKQFCKDHAAKEIAELLRAWVNDDQPDGFLDGMGTRSMGALAAECLGDRCGGYWDYMDFYLYMWGGGHESMDESEAEKRKNRNGRCGIH